MGFIGIDRDIENHWIYQDPEYFKVWFEILLRTRFSEEPERKLIDGSLVTIEYGEFIFGRVSWSKRTKVSEKRLRTLFDKLIADGMIVLKTRNQKFSKYFVVNFEKYNKIGHQKGQQSGHHEPLEPQGLESNEGQQTGQQEGQQGAIRGPSEGHTITKKQSNKVNKVIKNIYAEFVTMTESEYEKLISEHGDYAVKEMIDILNSYKASTGKKYKSDYHTMTGRGWVLERFRKETISQRQPAQQSKGARQMQKFQDMLREAEERERNRSGETSRDPFG